MFSILIHTMGTLFRKHTVSTVSKCPFSYDIPLIYSTELCGQDNASCYTDFISLDDAKLLKGDFLVLYTGIGKKNTTCLNQICVCRGGEGVQQSTTNYLTFYAEKDKNNIGGRVRSRSPKNNWQPLSFLGSSLVLDIKLYQST